MPKPQPFILPNFLFNKFNRRLEGDPWANITWPDLEQLFKKFDELLTRMEIDVRLDLSEAEWALESGQKEYTFNRPHPNRSGVIPIKNARLLVKWEKKDNEFGGSMELVKNPAKRSISGVAKRAAARYLN